MLSNVSYHCLCFYLGCRYLFVLQFIKTLPHEIWYCNIWIAIAWMSSLCSTLFILNMTFERFYSIIRPHKAASFNTVKRAKISVTCIVCVSIVFNIPHLFTTKQVGKSCVPFGNAIVYITGQMYYWLSLTVNFFLPFLLLLIMNSIIIKTLRKRHMINSKYQGQGRSEGQASKMKNVEKQIFLTLLLVTFGFLVLTAPSYSLFVYVMVYNYEKSPQAFAGYYFFYEIGRETYYTNYGINFFFYVISGQKFRADLVRLVTCCVRQKQPQVSVSRSAVVPTISSSL